MRMRQISLIVASLVVALLALGSALMVLAGSTDSPGEPGDTYSYTLEDIYDRLNTGAAGTPITFTEPISGPTVSTGHTLSETMAIAPAVDDTNGAGLRDVQAGMTYWGLTSSDWGLQTGKGTGVPMTGQTGCWDQSGDSIDCAGTGQDGEYQLGHLPAVSPGNLDRFTDNGDGTVTDNLTRLVWLKNANCAGATKNWSTALSYSNALYDGCTNCFGTSSDCGLSDDSSAGDWRLPNFNELHSLVVDSGQTDPALPPVHPFTDVQPSLYWSSTTLASFPLSAWDLDLRLGTAHNSPKTFSEYVWPVRGGQ